MLVRDQSGEWIRVTPLDNGNVSQGGQVLRLDPSTGRYVN